MGEEDYNELFGLEPETETEDVSEPEPEEIPENSPPAEGEGGGETVDAPEEKPEGKPAGKPEGIRDTGLSRRTGADGAARPEDTAYIDSVIRGLKITDPYTHKPITTKAEYDAYQERAHQERRQQIRDRTGMSEEELNEFIETLPEVRKAREDGERAREMIRLQREREARARVDGEIAKIAAMDPTVKSIGDLLQSESYQAVVGMVKRGYELSDAWKLANFDKLRGQAQAASRQAAINSQAGRAGLTRTRQAGQGDDSVPVPRDELELYRALNPEMSDAEIRADYNRYRKSIKAAK